MARNKLIKRDYEIKINFETRTTNDFQSDNFGEMLTASMKALCDFYNGFKQTNVEVEITRYDKSN